MIQPSTLSSSTIDFTDSHLWDLAGIDGLQLAKRLDAAADRLALFQSLETTIDQQPCSLLRLCEGNFRLRVQSQVDIAALLQVQPSGWRVWVKQCVWMSAIALPESVGFRQLPKLAIPKPPHRLAGMVVDRAVPVRINGFAALLWRHSVCGQPAFELHTASQNLERLVTALVQSMDVEE